MRSPSEKLIRVLSDSGLCSARELADCEPFVAQLSRDLPDFDSVWLDALVQRRLLTPWQAQQIQTGLLNTVTVGHLICLDQSGRNSFVAADRGVRVFYHLHRISNPVRPTTHPAPHPSAKPNAKCNWDASGGEVDRQTAAPVARICDLVRSVAGKASQAPGSLILPQVTIDAEDGSGSAWVVSEYATGWSLEELLIRGGRFPWPVVAEIGRELLSALEWLETQQMRHGEIVLRNVRITTGGRVVLTDAFLRRHLTPFVTLSDQLTLRDCDGISPEQIGSGRPADVRSELYALGCLLWQCLTSRPVVLNADPVTRLRKLGEHDVIDVRTWVPDCPEWMAHSIMAMTRRSPELRPAVVSDVLKLWRHRVKSGLSQCRVIARKMPDCSGKHQPPVRRRRLEPWTAIPARSVIPSAENSGETAGGRATVTMPSTHRGPGLKNNAVDSINHANDPSATKSAVKITSTTVRKSPPRRAIRRTPRWPALAVVAAVLLMMLTAFQEFGLTTQPLFFGPTADAIALSDGTPVPDEDVFPMSADAGEAARMLDGSPESPQSNWLWPLPPLDASGTIQLVAGRHYLASDISSAGLVQIETPNVTNESAPVLTTRVLPAIVYVPPGRHWSVSADQVMMRGIQIQGISARSVSQYRVAGTTGSQPIPSPLPLTGSQAALLAANTSLLVLEQCWLSGDENPKEWSCVSWTAPKSANGISDLNDAEVSTGPQSTELLLRDVAITGAGYGIRLQQPPTRLQLDNVLLRTNVSGIRCDVSDPDGESLPISMNRVTQRTGASLLDVVVRIERQRTLSDEESGNGDDNDSQHSDSQTLDALHGRRHGRRIRSDTAGFGNSSRLSAVMAG
ncbi:MAG: protein kinase [Planctomycetaceae bacterium]